MATEILTVNGDGAIATGWTAEGGNYTHVTSDDGDTTRLYSPLTNDIRDFTVTSPTSISGAIINKVSVFAKVRGVDPISCTYRLRIRTHDTAFSAETKDTAGVTSYQLVSNEWALNPSTGLAWTEAELADIQPGIEKINAPAGCITYMYVEVDYAAGSPPPSGEIITHVWKRIS